MTQFLIFALLSMVSFAKPAELKFTPRFVLEKVLERKNLSFNPEKDFPTIKFASQSSLKEFQDDVEYQWGMRPDQITNVYVVNKNTIYLLDDSNYYESTKRFIDDSLAHELAHYVQVVYQGWDLSDDSLEGDAIDAQTWFRETFCESRQ